MGKKLSWLMRLILHVGAAFLHDDWISVVGYVLKFYCARCGFETKV